MRAKTPFHPLISLAARSRNIPRGKGFKVLLIGLPGWRAVSARARFKVGQSRSYPTVVHLKFIQELKIANSHGSVHEIRA